MWPHVVQFETRRLQTERELQLAREIEAARVRRETTPTPPRARHLRPATRTRLTNWNTRTARSRP
jgi:hypothetical protein